MNSKMDSKFTGMWVSFFTAAGIPSDVSATYALTFTENRIQNDMLLDLNKEYLKDMGITRMGDVIAILRHAKQVHETAARDKVLGAAGAGGKVPVAAVTGRATVAQPSSPATRILEHYTRNPQGPDAAGTSQGTGKRSSNEMIGTQELQTKKMRQIRFDVESKEGVNKTVFARLGSNEPAAAKTVAKSDAKQPAKPIYARLGSKPAGPVAKPAGAVAKPAGPVAKPAGPVAIPVDKDALKYEGILKSPPTPKNVTITTTKHSRKIFTMRADETPVSVREKLTLPKAKSVKFSNQIQYKEIEKVTARPHAAQIFNKPERRLTMPEDSVKSRLGSKDINDLTITKNVFNRLGGV